MTIELDNYGLMLDTNWCYIALSWQLLITAGAVFAGYKFYKKWKTSNDNKQTTNNDCTTRNRHPCPAYAPPCYKGPNEEWT